MSKALVRMRPLLGPTLNGGSIKVAVPAQNRVVTSIAVDGETAPSENTRNADGCRSSNPPLSILPLPNLLRAYAITALSSYPTILKPSLRAMSMIAHSTSPFLNPDRNLVLHFLLKKTFYAQFCAGETPKEVTSTSNQLKKMGYKGVILAYGKEIVLSRGEKLEAYQATAATISSTRSKVLDEDIRSWKEGTLQTVKMSQSGDFVALKFSGAGIDAMRQLAAGVPPHKTMEDAIVDVCELAKERNVALLFDAEQDAVQKGIDAWTIDFQRRYNKGKAMVFGTYQAYLRATPTILAQHLDIARRGDFVLGVKLVRGAYMSSDPRQIFWDAKEDTDKAYDGITEALATKTWNGTLQPAPGSQEMPDVSIVLATHNLDSVEKCMEIRRQQTEKGEKKIELAYGQLMGMADEVSCELVMAGKRNQQSVASGSTIGPSAFKYCVWGSVGECLKYLIRRAEENRDSMSRAQGTRIALGAEIRRRLFG